MAPDPRPEPPSTTSPADKEMLSLGVTYAWNWTDSYTKARAQLANFYLVTSAFVVASYVTVLVNRVSIAAFTIAVYGAVSSLLFLVVARGVRTYVELGEQALAELESVLADKLNVDALKLTFHSRRGHPSGRHYFARLEWLIYLGSAVGWSAAAIFASLRR